MLCLQGAAEILFMFGFSSRDYVFQGCCMQPLCSFQNNKGLFKYLITLTSMQILPSPSYQNPTSSAALSSSISFMSFLSFHLIRPRWSFLPVNSIIIYCYQHLTLIILHVYVYTYILHWNIECCLPKQTKFFKGKSCDYIPLYHPYCQALCCAHRMHKSKLLGKLTNREMDRKTVGTSEMSQILLKI